MFICGWNPPPFRTAYPFVVSLRKAYDLYWPCVLHLYVQYNNKSNIFGVFINLKIIKVQLVTCIGTLILAIISFSCVCLIVFNCLSQQSMCSLSNDELSKFFLVHVYNRMSRLLFFQIKWSLLKVKYDTCAPLVRTTFPFAY